MTKHLTAIGNSYGIVIDKPVLELLKIGKDTQLEVSTDGNRLIITPVPGEHKARVRQATRHVMKVHTKVLEKLAK